MKIRDEIIIHNRRIIAKSYAKINLTLDVLGKLENGYHEIETIMQTVGLFDLVITDVTEGEMSLCTSLKYLPANEKNIAWKAAENFFKRTGIKKGAKIYIHKNIPVSAGLAGGSGNAAAVLESLNMFFGCPISDEELFELAAELGADVPFCIAGGTQLCRGIGEKLEEIESFPKKYVSLVKPPIAVSTAEIYDKIDNEPIEAHPTTKQFMENSYASQFMFNVMEQVTIKSYPVIKGIKEKLLLNGAEAAMMSGSGSTVFGLFNDYKKAKASADSFSLFYRDVYLTSTN